MPLTYKYAVKTVAGSNSEDATLAVWYLDEFGQPRYFEFRNNVPAGWVDATAFGKELIQQVNDLLARPRPSEGTVKRGGVAFNCNVRPSSPEDEIALRAATKESVNG